METKKTTQKALQPTMIIRPEKCKDYFYKLTNGQELRFPDKNWNFEQTKAKTYFHKDKNNQYNLAL